MSRAPIVVRTADPNDADDLVDVWAESMRDQDLPGGPERWSADGPTVPEVGEAALAIGRIAADPAEQLLVAEVDGRPVGAVHLRRGPVSPIRQLEAVHLSHLQVLPQHRRRGVASALLSAATAWAEEKDSTHLLATSPASTRDAHRFLARLGFGQISVTRAASVTALRARFAAAAAGSRDTGRLIAQRRTLRRRHGRTAPGLAG